MDAVAGRLVRLPCYVRPLGPADSISLVLWYRGEDISGTPIYSVDARHTQFQKAQHFTSKPYQERQLMNFTLTTLEVDAETSSNSTSSSLTKTSSASTAHLYLMPVEESDAGLYWCRVDYKYERTTISIVTVNVIGEFHLQFTWLFYISYVDKCLNLLCVFLFIFLALPTFCSSFDRQLIKLFFQ